MSGERPLPRTAAEWIARLNADGRTSDDEDAFRIWLAADEANVTAFERATDIWALVPGTGAVPGVAPKGASAPPVLTRRRMIAACAGTLVAGGGMFAMQTAYAGTRYQTAIGEQRRLTLAEGSSLFLDADTDLRVVADARRRHLWLERGRVSLVVRPTPTPFSVEVGGGSFMAANGHFDLRRDGDDRLAMTALTGQAMVAVGGRQTRLTAGERLRSDPVHAVRIDRPDAEVTLAWQSGRAAFHEDRLDAVAAEANRYSLNRLEIADPHTAGLRVSGMYHMGDNVALGHALAQLLSIPIRQVDDRIVLGG